MGTYSIGDTARLSGVSVRTVRYYDQIGLLKACEVRTSGYRYYDDAALARLQQILFYRTLDFSLEEITRLLGAPGYDARGALRRQRQLLLARCAQMRDMAGKIDQLLGEETMKNEQTQDYGKLKTQYQQEARARYGSTPEYAQSEEKAAARTPAQEKGAQAETAAIFAAFGKLAAGGASPEGGEAQETVKRWRDCIQQNYYACSDAVFAGLAEMYVQDERFRDNLDQNGAGTAAFMRAAMLASLGKKA